jgi:hypothetical protein
VEVRVEEDIVRADPVRRRRALLLLPIILVVGVGMLAAAPRATRMLLVWLQESPHGRERAVVAMLGFAAPFTLLAWVIGFDSVRRSLHTLRARQFPPPGTPVLRDTPVLRGRTAQMLGVVGLALGTLLLRRGHAVAVHRLSDWHRPARRLPAHRRGRE